MATDINCVTLVGRLTSDMQVKYTNQGLAIGDGSLAVNRQTSKEKKEVSFFEYKLFGKRAEALKDYMKKGQQVAIQGFLKQERWEKEDKKYSRVTIGVEEIELLGSGKNEGTTTEETPAYDDASASFDYGA